MVTVGDICGYMDTVAPFSMKFDFDNIGLMVGDPARPVTRILTALDATEAVVDEAKAWGAELIVTHHPLIFHPLKSLRADEPQGRKLMDLIRAGISVLSFHTNLDAAEGGVNDVLMAALGAEVTGLLDPHGAHPDGTPYGVARLGELPEPMEFETFLQRTKAVLRCKGLRYVGGRPVHRLACCGGSGGGELEAVLRAGCDTYVTADLKYDQFLLAEEYGLNLIDADHFCTEHPVIPELAALLQGRFPDLEVRVSRALGPTIRFA